MAVFKILTLSDKLVGFIYSPKIRELFSDVDLVVGCGDLPYYYLEYIINKLDVPLYYVRGNHAYPVEYSETGSHSEPHGGEDLHRRVKKYKGILMAGVEGSLRYRSGRYQYTQMDMWKYVFLMVPLLLKNRIVYGRYLDIFVTHASPWGIHDQTDLPHQGIKAFRWLDQVFKPSYHFHGHVHIYRPDMTTETQFGKTRVINSYGYRKIELEIPFIDKAA
jgi:Icc-related predicted phosphoesterase